mgnify:CR=1 FL=1
MPTEIKRSWTNIRLEDLHSIAKEIWTLLPHAHLVALDAEMGSGKTTLVRALLQEAQIAHFEGSPTTTSCRSVAQNFGDAQDKATGSISCH